MSATICPDNICTARNSTHEGTIRQERHKRQPSQGVRTVQNWLHVKYIDECRRGGDVCFVEILLKERGRVLATEGRASVGKRETPSASNWWRDIAYGRTSESGNLLQLTINYSDVSLLWGEQTNCLLLTLQKYSYASREICAVTSVDWFAA